MISTFQRQVASALEAALGERVLRREEQSSHSEAETGLPTETVLILELDAGQVHIFEDGAEWRPHRGDDDFCDAGDERDEPSARALAKDIIAHIDS